MKRMLKLNIFIVSASLIVMGLIPLATISCSSQGISQTTKYIDLAGKEKETSNRDLSDLNIVEVTRIGHFKNYKGIQQTVILPKKVQIIPYKLSKDIKCLARMFKGSEASESIVKTLSSWDVSHVECMQEMFAEAKSFNHDLSHWAVDNVTKYDGFAKNSGFHHLIDKHPKFKKV